MICTRQLFGLSKTETTFFANVLQNRVPQAPSNEHSNNIMNILKYKPSVKERAWFMAFFNAGAFFLRSLQLFYRDAQNQDIGIFFNHEPKLESFLKRNCVIAPYDTFDVTRNFLPSPDEKRRLLKLFQRCRPRYSF